jgi:hypothetical protein
MNMYVIMPNCHALQGKRCCVCVHAASCQSWQVRVILTVQSW